jgi:hypothetical protein
MGDLFFTNKAIYYIKYRWFEQVVPIGVLSSAAMLGLVGGVIAKRQEETRLTRALQNSARIRKEDSGISLQERLSKQPGSELIAMEDIKLSNYILGWTMIT